MGSNYCAMSRVGMSFAWVETGVDKCVSLCWTSRATSTAQVHHKLL